MYQFLKTNRYFAVVLDNLEQVAAEELKEIGAEEINTKYRGVFSPQVKKPSIKLYIVQKLLQEFWPRLLLLIAIVLNIFTKLPKVSIGMIFCQ